MNINQIIKQIITMKRNEMKQRTHSMNRRQFFNEPKSTVIDYFCLYMYIILIFRSLVMLHLAFILTRIYIFCFCVVLCCFESIPVNTLPCNLGLNFILLLFIYLLIFFFAFLFFSSCFKLIHEWTAQQRLSQYNNFWFHKQLSTSIYCNSAHFFWCVHFISFVFVTIKRNDFSHWLYYYLPPIFPVITKAKKNSSEIKIGHHRTDTSIWNINMRICTVSKRVEHAKTFSTIFDKQICGAHTKHITCLQQSLATEANFINK